MSEKNGRLKTFEKLAAKYRVDGKKFSLKDWDPGDTAGLEPKSKEESSGWLKLGIDRLAKLQDKLYAADRHAVLCIFQAMDASGKDSTIKHVMSGINPQGCQVYSFKQPSAEELDHDYMWRYMRCLPERGRIGIFNRSYYEEVLVVRVHEQILKAQRLPDRLITSDIWDTRLEDIANFEKYLNHNGIAVVKFYLNLSQEEQKKRFLARIDRPDKNWKFDGGDLSERALWKNYAKAFEAAISQTATKDSPWYIIPADNKWFTRLAVAEVLVSRLEDLNLRYPKVDKAKLEMLAEARKTLESEGTSKRSK